MQAKDPLFLCYYPTTVFLIDDNEEHLEFYGLFLKRAGIHCRTFTDPELAVDELNKVLASNYWVRMMKNNESKQTQPDQDNILMNITHLHKAIYDFERFQDIGAAIFDKQMPVMDGMEAIHRNHQRGLACIMLTGYHDTQDVIDLMTEGLITAYVQKHDENALDELLKAILKAQKIYFAGERGTLAAQQSLLPELFRDPNFVLLYHQLKDEYKIIEHYAMDHSGSCLMLDAKGNAYLLAAFTEEDLKAAKFELTQSDIEPTQDIIDAVTQEKKLPYFLNIDRYEIHANDWGDFLIDVKPGPGERFHYAVLTENLDKYGIDSSKIKSYKDYLKSEKE